MKIFAIVVIILILLSQLKALYDIRTLDRLGQYYTEHFEKYKSILKKREDNPKLLNGLYYTMLTILAVTEIAFGIIVICLL